MFVKAVGFIKRCKARIRIKGYCADYVMGYQDACDDILTEIGRIEKMPTQKTKENK